MAGAHRVAMPRLAVDLLAAMLGNGVVADQADDAAGPEVADHEAAEQAGQEQAGPLGGGEDAVVAGGVTVGQIGDRQVKLAADKDEAFTRYHELMAKPPLPPEGRDRITYWEGNFGLMVTKAGHKSFVVQYRVGRQSKRCLVRLSLARRSTF